MYHFTYRTSAKDLWLMSMYYTYGSIVGVCNIIFTAAMFVVTPVLWENVNDIMKVLLIFGCCIFTIFQPLLVWNKARNIAKGIQYDTNLVFDDSGMHIHINHEHADVAWKKIAKIAKKPTMLIVYSDAVHGYVLTNKTLADQKDAFYRYVLSKVE